MNMSRRYILAMACAAFGLSLATSAGAAGRSVTVKVVDEAGAVVAGVQVVVACDREFVARTDANGEVQFQTTATDVQVTVGSGASASTTTSKSSTITLTAKGRS